MVENSRGSRGGKKPGGRAGSGGRSGGRPREQAASREEYHGPEIPTDIDARMLGRSQRRALDSLPDKLADRVARHLVAAGRSLAEDPETAYRHARAARARAPRVALVREASGETAYATGRFAEALSELRAARRLNGATYYLAMMADCERALGRPERAIRMDTADARAQLDVGARVELSIVISGARRDLGQPDAAVRLLEGEPLHSGTRADWVARLTYAYADALLDAGRPDDALEWFHRTLAVDPHGITDAEDRLTALDPDAPIDQA